MSSPSATQPSPQLFFQTINAYQRTEGLKAAIELETFTAIGEGNAGFARSEMHQLPPSIQQVVVSYK
jgi:hypothetical protein